MKILVTAFEPFDNEPINPTMLMLERLPVDYDGHEIFKLVLPTVFGKSAEIALAQIAAFEPEAVLSLGQAGGRAVMTLERVAINVNDATIPDNAGAQPVDEPIVPDGPAAYFSTLPNKAIVTAMREAGIPAAISNSAGTYVCNQILYAVLHCIAENKLPAKAGFMHVPYLPVQVADKPNMPSMSQDDMVRALEIAIRVISRDGI